MGGGVGGLEGTRKGDETRERQGSGRNNHVQASTATQNRDNSLAGVLTGKREMLLGVHHELL